jgi:hypothetical protein
MQPVKLAILLAPEQFEMLLNCAVVQATHVRVEPERETGGYDSFLTSEGTIPCPNNIDPSEWSVTNEEAAFIPSR